MKTKILGLLCSALVICLSGCGIKAPNENDFKSMIPDEVLSYQYDGEICRSQITELEIVRQQTGEKEDTADCRIVLEDENLTRTAFLTINSKYWDKGGWMMDTWERTKPEECECKSSDNFDYSRFQYDILEQGFDTVSVEPVDLGKDGHNGKVHQAQCFVSGDEEFLSYDGVIGCEARLVRRDDGESAAYYWETTYKSDGQISYDWNINGIYYVEELVRKDRRDHPYVYVKPHITYSAISSDNRNVMIGQMPVDGYFESQVEYRYYNAKSVSIGQESSNHLYKKGDCPSNMYLELPLNIINWGVNWIMRIHSDYAEIADAEYLNEHGEFMPIERIEWLAGEMRQ